MSAGCGWVGLRVGARGSENKISLEASPARVRVFGGEILGGDSS